MKSLFKLVIVIAVLTISAFISLSVFFLPSPQSLMAEPVEFSAERAMKHVESIASKIHPVGSPEQKGVREYIVKELEALGLTPETQKGYGTNDAEGFMGFVPYAGELENIYARLEGTGSTSQDILMVAHYDSTLGGQGAADDASGAAVLLETARALMEGTPLMNDIVFLFTDGEEAELLGSKLFTDNKDELKNVSLVMNFDARGNRGPSILFETSEGNDWLMGEFAKAAPNPMAYSFTSDASKMVTNITDFAPLINVGKSGFNFANLEGMETYHNPQDTPENLDRGSLQHQGSYAISLAGHFGNIPLDYVKSSNNAVYFTIARSVMVLYSVKWTIPLTILALILLAVILLISFRKRFISLNGIIKGSLISLLSVVAIAVFGIVAQLLFSGIYYKLDNVLSLPDLVDLRRTLVLQGNTWIVISLILSVVILFILQRIFREKISGSNLLLGNIFIWAILAVISAFVLPCAGYMFLWPLMLSLVGMLIDFSIRKRNSNYTFSFILSTIACVLIFIPVGYLLFEALTMLGAAIPIVILSIPAGLVILNASLFAEKNKDAAEYKPYIFGKTGTVGE